MAARVTFFILSIALLLINTYADGGSVVFSYSGDTGPDNWGSLSQDYIKCSNGTKQSPIDIATDSELNDTLTALAINYQAANATLLNKCYSVALHYDGDAGKLIVDGKNYTLEQMHWHTPSEHKLDGVVYEAELHLVHASDDGSHTVVAILYQVDKNNDSDPVLDELEDQLEELGVNNCSSLSQIPVGSFDPNLVGQSTCVGCKYYRYLGSLTTPPCSENVLWHVLGNVRNISNEQVQALQAPLDSGCKKNARPVQQLNARPVDRYDDNV